MKVLAAGAASAVLAIIALAQAPAGYPPVLTIPTPAVSVEVREHVLLARITYYNAVPWQTDADPHISACGPNRPNQVAVSRDLFRRVLHCGDEVEVYIQGEPLGRFVVWDTMHPRFKKTLDILTETSYTWGRTKGHLIVLD